MSFKFGDKITTKNGHKYLSGVDIFEGIIEYSNIPGFWSIRKRDYGSPFWVIVLENEITLITSKPNLSSNGQPNVYQTPNTTNSLHIQMHGSAPFIEIDLASFGIPIGEYGVESKPKSCIHTMVEYIGLTEKYKYCSKCDKKEGHI
jgi:hypothetical protein